MSTETNPPAKVTEPKATTPPAKLREDGPTLEEYVERGYKAENYPPVGYAARPSYRYYRKELLSNYFYVEGKPVAFEPLDGNRGVLKADPRQHAKLIAALDQAASEQKGGIVRITYEEYVEKKNRFPFNPSSPSAQRFKDEKLKIAPRPGMQGKAFRPPPPKVNPPSAPAVQAAAGGEKAPPGAEIVDGVPQAPNSVPDFVPRMGRAAPKTEDPK